MTARSKGGHAPAATPRPRSRPRYQLSERPVEINAGRRTARVTVTNAGDRAIQVGSHFHFFEANRALRFDRPATLGMRLNIPSGTTVRFEPGASRDVELVEYGGKRHVAGFNDLMNGGLQARWSVRAALARAAEQGFAYGDRPMARGR